MLGFLCTGPNPAWSPLCDGKDLLILLIVAAMIGGGVGYGFHRILEARKWLRLFFSLAVGIAAFALAFGVGFFAGG